MENPLSTQTTSLCSNSRFVLRTFLLDAILLLLMAAVAYTILVRALLAAEGPNSRLAAALGRDAKGWVSLACYAAAIPLAFVYEGIALSLYVFVALMWLVPDRRIENRMTA